MYEELLREAEREGVEVISWSLKGNTKGAYYNGVIALGKNITTTSEKTCVLAEELGHYHTSVGDILDQTKISNRQQERRAKGWTFRRLVSLDKLIEAYEIGIDNRFELAEYLHVTEPFLEAAINYYKEKHGIFCRVGEYWICFEPLRVINKRQLKPL